MSQGQILALGAVAGLTIFLGLPIGRARAARLGLKAFLSATATGILIFLLWDVISHGIDPVRSALESANSGGGSWGHFLGLGAVFAGCFAAGLLSLVYYDRWMGRQRAKKMLGPGTASAEELVHPGPMLSPAQLLALLIATGIGLHNFAEGLAIGQSASTGATRLALMLVIGFGLHNATEGFGIVAPMAGDAKIPSWRFLGLLGLIGGAPTFVGTLLGQAWASQAVSVGFMALAAGSILYVVIELMNVCRKFGTKTVVSWGILVGLLAGFSTDFILIAAGA